MEESLLRRTWDRSIDVFCWIGLIFIGPLFLSVLFGAEIYGQRRSIKRSILTLISNAGLFAMLIAYKLSVNSWALLFGEGYLPFRAAILRRERTWRKTYATADREIRRRMVIEAKQARQYTASLQSFVNKARRAIQCTVHNDEIYMVFVG